MSLIGTQLSTTLAHSILTSMNSALQCPTWGYPTEGAYYRDAASTDSLMGIRIPFLSVQAEDDPVSEHSYRKSWQN